MTSEQIGEPGNPVHIDSDDAEREVLRRLRILLAEKDFTIITCAQPEGSTRFPITYSLGLARKGLPEVFLIGSHPLELMADVAGCTANDWFEGRTTPDGPQAELLTGEDGSSSALKVRPIDAEALTSIHDIGLMRDFYGTMPSVMQLLLPDNEGHFSTEDNYDQASFPQPLMEPFVSSERVH